jgi:transposase-like protein
MANRRTISVPAIPPDPNLDAAPDGYLWFGVGQVAKRWEAYQLLVRDRKSMQETAKLVGVTTTTIGSWADKWREYWPGLHVGMVRVGALVRSEGEPAQTQEFASEALTDAGFQALGLFARWAEQVDDEALVEWEPADAVRIGKLAKELMAAADELAPGSGPRRGGGGTVTNNLMIEVAPEGSAADRLGAMLQAWNQEHANGR